MLISAKCSKCGGSLTLIEGSGKWFCGHCGVYSTLSGKKGQSNPPPPPSTDKNDVIAEVEAIGTYKLEKSGKGRLINAKCPNCGAMLELPEKLDRAFCQFCGGNVIIARDEIHHHYGSKPAIACPECEGLGYKICSGQSELIDTWDKSIKIQVSSCFGKGKCNTAFINALTLAINPYIEPCKNGVCGICKGKGKVWFFRRKCRFCDETGKCQICNGSGKCKLCNGEGKFKCKACNGTGFKVYEGK